MFDNDHFYFFQGGKKKLILYGLAPGYQPDNLKKKKKSDISISQDVRYTVLYMVMKLVSEFELRYL